MCKKIISCLIALSIANTVFFSSSVKAEDYNYTAADYYYGIKDVNKCSRNVYEGNALGGNGYVSLDELINIRFKYEPYFPTISLNKKALNVEILVDRELVVYGESTNVENNEFQTQEGGYFTKNSKKGEYKYLGYDCLGNPVFNPYFDVKVKYYNYSSYDLISFPWKIDSLYNKYNLIDGEKNYIYSHIAGIQQDRISNFKEYTAVVNDKKIKFKDF